jgi:heat shock protein HslJ
MVPEILLSSTLWLAAWLTPYQTTPIPAEMMCGTQRVAVRVDQDEARVTVAGRTFVMKQVPAASGAKYEVEGGTRTSYWSRGQNATLVVDGKTYPECTPAGGTSKPAAFRASGNEPGWTLQISGNTLTLVTEYGAKTTTVRLPKMESVADGRRYAGSAEGRVVTATVYERICRDPMTGMPHPNTVEVNIDGTVLNGCGGNPGALVQGVTWVVQSVGGSPIVPKSRATVTFGADGMVSGSSSCNSYRGSYTITGEGLTIGQTAGTRKACLPDLMAQETTFLGVLRDVRRFDLQPDGTLTLETADGRTIVATKGK